MRTSVPILALLFTVAVALPGAHAQSTHAAPQSALDAAVQQHTSTSSADRDTVMQLLQREDVKEVAGKAGIDLRRAAGAAATLEGDDLAAAASQARQVEQALAGGQSRVTISTTMIIIALLVVILIVVAVD
jgi:hypothetical protein